MISVGAGGAGGAGLGVLGTILPGLAAIFAKPWGAPSGDAAARDLADIFARQSIEKGVMPSQYKEFFDSIKPANSDPGLDYITPNGIPRWLEQRFQETGVMGQGGLNDPLWMKLIQNPLAVLTPGIAANVSRPWHSQFVEQQPAEPTQTAGGGEQGAPEPGTPEWDAWWQQIYNQLMIPGLADISTTVGGVQDPTIKEPPPAVNANIPDLSQVQYGWPSIELPPWVDPTLMVGAPPTGGQGTVQDPYDIGYRIPVDVVSTLPNATITAPPPVIPAGKPSATPTTPVPVAPPYIPSGISPTPVSSPTPGTITPGPVPGVDVPPVSGANVSIGLPDLIKGLGGFGGGGFPQAGGWPSAPQAPQLGAGAAMKSVFELPGPVQPPPTLGQLLAMVRKGGIL